MKYMFNPKELLSRAYSMSHATLKELKQELHKAGHSL